MYVATRDAVGSLLASAFGRKGARIPTPWYLESELRASGLTGAELEASVRRLGAAFPGRVSERPN